MQPLDPGHIDARASGIHLEAVGVDLIAAGGRYLAGCLGDSDRSQPDDLVGHCPLGADARHRLSIEAAAVQLRPPGATQRVDWSVELKLRVERAGKGQILAGERQQIVQADFGGAKPQMQRGVGVECWNPARRSVERAIECDLGLPAA